MNIAELEPILREHQLLLEYSFQRPSFLHSPQYKLIAGQLRVLLCDDKCPVLLKYADYCKVNLYTWSPPPLPEELASFVRFSVNYDIAEWLPSDLPRVRFSIRDFLDTPIGHELINGDTIEVGTSYTPRNIIKWIANKEGVAHYDFNKPKVLRSLMKWTLHAEDKTSDAPFIKSHISSMGNWCLRAIQELLNAPAPFSIACKVRCQTLTNEDTIVFGLKACNSGIQFKVCLKGQDVVVEKVQRLNGRQHSIERHLLTKLQSNATTLFLEYCPATCRIVVTSEGIVNKLIVDGNFRYVIPEQAVLLPPQHNNKYFHLRLRLLQGSLSDSQKIYLSNLHYDEWNAKFGVQPK